ncbi:Uncharacterized protein APZ42_000427 [Daphnia magna]|uniref:Uncharacterized protein n=1 Tax=Daphnia magna TaxID=35525 RepID=A0A164JNL2_9CRUS|nr:Uncharacterized protein APZ42_000427 [Daphnia magna]
MHLYTTRLKVKKGWVYNNFYFYHKLLSAGKVAFVTTFLLGGAAVARRSCCGLLHSTNEKGWNSKDGERFDTTNSNTFEEAKG